MSRIYEAGILLAALAAAALITTDRPCQAQEGPTVRSIGIGVRADYFANQDRLVSPRVHDAVGFSQGGVHLALASERSAHELEAWFGSLPLAADDGFEFQRRGGTAHTPESNVSLGDARYTHLRRLGGGAWWVGGAAAFTVSHSEYELGAGSTEAFFYRGTLEAAGRREVELGGDRRVSFTLRIPLIGWGSRPTWSTVDEARLQSSNDFLHRVGEGEVMWVGELRAASGDAAYTQDLSDHVGLRASARLSYTRVSEPDRFTSFRAGVDLTVTLWWPGGDR